MDKMKDKEYFYLSGLVSISIYLVVGLLFLFYVNSPTAKKYDISTKATVLELELITNKSEKKQVAKKSEKKVEQIVKKSTSRSNKQKADFKSLFANVKTKSKNVVEKETTTQKASIDPSRFRSKFQKQKKTDNVSVSKLLNDVKTTTNKQIKSTSNKGEEHEYFSKVKEILWQRWNPKLLENGLIVKVLVMITNSGDFDYRIIKYSNDVRFDESLKEFLDSQVNESFPTHNINDKVDIIINFKSEG